MICVYRETVGNEKILDYAEILVTGQSELPTGSVTFNGQQFTPAPGSVAYIADMSEIYMKNESGSWNRIGG